jgi:hypothetical protein
MVTERERGRLKTIAFLGSRELKFESWKENWENLPLQVEKIGPEADK